MVKFIGFLTNASLIGETLQFCEAMQLTFEAKIKKREFLHRSIWKLLPKWTKQTYGFLRNILKFRDSNQALYRLKQSVPCEQSLCPFHLPQSGPGQIRITKLQNVKIIGRSSKTITALKLQVIANYNHDGPEFGQSLPVLTVQKSRNLLDVS